MTAAKSGLVPVLAMVAIATTVAAALVSSLAAVVFVAIHVTTDAFVLATAWTAVVVLFGGIVAGIRRLSRAYAPAGRQATGHLQSGDPR